MTFSNPKGQKVIRDNLNLKLDTLTMGRDGYFGKNLGFQLYRDKYYFAIVMYQQTKLGDQEDLPNNVCRVISTHKLATGRQITEQYINAFVLLNYSGKLFL